MDKRIRIVFDRQKAASDVTRGVVEVIVTLKGRRVYVNTRVKLFDFQWKDGEVVNHQDNRALNPNRSLGFLCVVRQREIL